MIALFFLGSLTLTVAVAATLFFNFPAGLAVVAGIIYLAWRGFTRR
ncbi:hypothetical protein [Allomeiothermus silvanus]|nr:hypothetical protein [Allomeiothermus silvanus]